MHPVFAKTEILEALLSDTSNDMLSKLERQIPVRKLAEVEDIANANTILASDESKMITGTELLLMEAFQLNNDRCFRTFIRKV